MTDKYHSIWTNLIKGRYTNSIPQDCDCSEGMGKRPFALDLHPIEHKLTLLGNIYIIGVPIQIPSVFCIIGVISAKSAEIQSSYIKAADNQLLVAFIFFMGVMPCKVT